MMPKIKYMAGTCPFCGVLDKARYGTRWQYGHNQTIARYYVFCDACLGRSEVYGTKAEARVMWQGMKRPASG
jgi:hypothetical protein